MAAVAVSHVYPLGSRLNEHGRLEVGGCDLADVAREFGTPAYVYAEDDMRARARAYVEALGARTDSFEVVYAAKAFPATAAFRLMAEEGLSCDVASAGELHLALAGGFDPARIYMHGNNKTQAELDYARERGVGHVVVDSFDEIDRLEGTGQRVLIRVTPGIKASTHSYIQTGQADSKFGFPLSEVPRAVERCAEAGLELRGLHAHIGSQIFDLEAFEAVAEVLRGIGEWPLLNLGGGLGIAYTTADEPPSDRGLRGGAAAPRAAGGEGALRARPLAGGERRGDRLHRGHRQTGGRRADLGRGGRRHVRQPAADALRRPLRGGDRGPLRRGRAVHGRRACTASPGTCSCATCRSTTPARATCS